MKEKASSPLPNSDDKTRGQKEKSGKLFRTTHSPQGGTSSAFENINTIISLPDTELEETRSIPPPPIEPGTKLEDNTQPILISPTTSDEEVVSYNTAQIRKLMTECYSYDELIAISFDELGAVYNEFNPNNMSKNQIIQHILDYVRRHSMEEILLSALEKINPDCYSKYEAKIGSPRRITGDEKLISLKTIEENIDKIVDLIKEKLKLQFTQAWPVVIQAQITVVISPSPQKVDKLFNLLQQQQPEDLQAKYNIEKLEATGGNIKLSLSYGAFVDKKFDKFKREIADKLGILANEIHFEKSKSTLITIALPGKKADQLLQLDRKGKLENWKKKLGVTQLKPQDNLDRYIQLVATLTISSETSLSLLQCEVDELKKIITDELKLSSKQVRLLTWGSRIILFTLVLPTQSATKLKTSKLDNIGIRDLQTFHVEIAKGKEGIFGTLTPALIKNKNCDAISNTRNTLADMLVPKIAVKLRIKPSEIKISWHNDLITFSFVLPSRFAAILFHRHSTGQLKKLLDFDIQDLRVGQYDWDNYLGLVPVTPG